MTNRRSTSHQEATVNVIFTNDEIAEIVHFVYGLQLRTDVCENGVFVQVDGEWSWMGNNFLVDSWNRLVRVQDEIAAFNRANRPNFAYTIRHTNADIDDMMGVLWKTGSVVTHLSKMGQTVVKNY